MTMHPFQTTLARRWCRMAFSALIPALLFAGTPVHAQAEGAGITGAQPAPEVEIVQLLQELGYMIVIKERTWLGRGRIVAERDGIRREVVFNPGTGEILRDYAFAFSIDLNRPGDSSAIASAGTATPVAPPALMPSVGVALDGTLSGSLGEVAPAPQAEE